MKYDMEGLLSREDHPIPLFFFKTSTPAPMSTQVMASMPM